MLPPRVKKVVPLPPSRVRLEYAGGEIRIFDMDPYLSKGIFQALRDPAMFNSVHPVLDSIEWANGADVDPEVLYEDSLPMTSDTNEE
jgi:hypothetical protein